MEDVAEYVDRIIVMNSGEVMFDGVPKEVFYTTRTRGSRTCSTAGHISDA